MLGYRELSVGFNQRFIVPVESDIAYADRIKKFVSDNPGKSLFHSLYLLDPTAGEYYKKNGNSIRGFEGKATSNELVFDFDSKENVDFARKDAVVLLERIKKESNLPRINDYIRVFFSGNKGFHIHLLTNKTYTNEEIKSICCKLAEGLKTFDTSIYDKVRIFRIQNTKHQDTPLYKVEIKPALLKKENALNTIKELAVKPIEGTVREEYKKITNTDFIDQYKNIKTEEKKPKSVIVDINETEDGIRGLDTIDFSECPKNMPKCLWALTKGIMVPGKGERHHIFLGLGNYFRNQGLSQTVVYNILKGIAKENAALYPEFPNYADPNKNQVKYQVMPMVFGKGIKMNTGGWGIDPQDEIFSRYCRSLSTFKRCPIHNKDRYNKVVKIDEVSDSFADFATNYDKNVIKTGLKFIDHHVEFMRGTVNSIIGSPGSGKTSISLNIMKEANKLGQHTAFFSLDTHKNMIYLKLGMALSGYTKKQIFEFYKNKNKYSKEISEIKTIISSHFDKTFFDFSSTLTMDDIKERILNIEDENDIQIKLAVIDYAGRLSGPYSDAYANATFNALKAKEVADDTNVCLLLVNQVSRANGDGSTPLRSKRVAKDSGAFEETCSSIITCWRPYMGMEERVDPETGVEFQDDIIRLFIAKNRMGSELERPLHWNGARSEIKDMTEEEYLDYKENREQDEMLAQRIKHNRNT